MLLPLLLTGCVLVSGPQDALKAARAAFAAKDLAAFEQAVDLEGVAPGLVKLCGAASLRQDYVARQFEPPHPLNELVTRLGKPWLMSALEENGDGLAQQLREQWGELDPFESCPSVSFGEPGLRAVWASRESGLLETPVHVQGLDTTVIVEVREVGEGWRVTGLDVDAALAAHEALLQEKARAQAQARVKQLDAQHPENWAALRAYLMRNPEARELQQAYDDAARPFTAAPTPLAVTDVSFGQAGFLGMKRVVKPAVHNVSGREVSAYRLRITFLGDQGEPVVSTSGEEAIIAAVTAPVAVDRVDRSGEVLTRPLEWPTLAQAQAVPVEVTYADGGVWVHPAVEAGIWSR